MSAIAPSSSAAQSPLYASLNSARTAPAPKDMQSVYDTLQAKPGDPPAGGPDATAAVYDANLQYQQAQSAMLGQSMDMQA